MTGQAGVGGWTCPDCGRLFGRARQHHDCAPGLTVEEYFSTGPAHERPVYEAVLAHIEQLGPVHADVVAVGIFLKNPVKFVELRPAQRWVSVSFMLDRRASHRAIVRKVLEVGAAYWHIANVRSPDDLDGPLRDLLSEAYERARPGPS